jgi:hypothetical protein
MEELKTLKDIEPNFSVGNPEEIGKFYPEQVELFNRFLGDFITKGRLRQEAINHIKSLTKKIRDLNFYNIDLKHKGDFEELEINEEEKNETKRIIHWIKYFFNITEEDLKGGESNGKN